MRPPRRTSREALRLSIARSAAHLAGLVLVALGLLALPTIAFASPPDPPWVQGIYDDADYDDVVGLIASAAADVGPPLVTRLRPIPLPTGNVAPAHAGPAPVFFLSQVPPRAPPFATASPLAPNPS